MESASPRQPSFRRFDLQESKQSEDQMVSLESTLQRETSTQRKANAAEFAHFDNVLQQQAQEFQSKHKNEVQPIGPIQLQRAFKTIMAKVDKDQKNMRWRNIPTVIKQQVDFTFEGLDFLKRFVLFMDHRFTQLQNSVGVTKYNLECAMD